MDIWLIPYDIYDPRQVSPKPAFTSKSPSEIVYMVCLASVYRLRSEDVHNICQQLWQMYDHPSVLHIASH